jgi:amino acid adenylation domain-containing protein
MLTENVEALLELSPMQQGMLFHSLYALQSGIYVEQIMGRLIGLLDVPAFERAWQMIVAHHQILRTSFFWEDLAQPTQVVHGNASLPFIQHDWRNLSPPEQQSRLESLIQADRAAGFDFSKPPLMRIILVRLTDSSYQFIWSSHHILLDGWSQSLVLKEVCRAYQGVTQGQEIQLEASRPFGDYVAWLQEQDQTDAEAFWRETLRGFSAPITIGIDRDPGAVNQEQRYEEAMAGLSVETTAALQTFARRHRLTTYTLVQAAWALLLSHYSGEDDIVFGATVSVRPPELEGIETTAGLFINTLPVRARIAWDESLLTWLQELQTRSVEARDFEHTRLVDIQQWSELPPGQSLFESILVFENYPTDESIWAFGSELKMSEARSIVSRTNYPLTLLAMPGAEFTLRLIYDGHRFESDPISRLLAHLSVLLEAMIHNPECRVSDLPRLTDFELQLLLVDWNSTQADYEDICVHQLFERQAKRTPDRIAVEFNGEEISYGDLNEKANRLAQSLHKLGVGTESLVGIFVERSIEMMVGLLGVMKAGGAYVPLDPSFPRDRLAFMVDDSCLDVLLTQKKLVADLPPHHARIQLLDDDSTSIASGKEDFSTSLTTANLAYVIYTSGSTGRPKGVQIEHRALTNFLQSVQREPGLSCEDVLLSVTTLSFDIAALELYLPLITGARLVIANRETASDGVQLQRLLHDSNATIMQATPAMWRMLLHAGWTGNFQLRILCGGEALARELANQLLAKCGSLWNMYGPTETTIWSALHHIQSASGPVAIGRPMANTQMFILDRNLHPVPLGASGELYIGGDGLARGYLGRPALTAEKFLPNPFSTAATERLYRTGDLARYLPDGNIECLGRADDQVKVRGFRIELGEIEAVIDQHPSVRQSVVVVREDVPGDKRLVAYIVSAAGNDASDHELRLHLKEKLPDYMMPSAYMTLAALPLTPNGKVNRRALPAPDFSLKKKDTFVAPRTHTESLLAEIWAEVLQLGSVGAQDNFFELGGHSLLATQVMSRVSQIFGVQLPLRALFESPTLAELCERIVAAQLAGDNSSLPVIKSSSTRDRAPLSFGQQSFWFLNQLNPDTSLYNIYRAVRIRGRLDINALQQALDEIVARHESLRTTLTIVGEEPVQVIAPRGRMNLKVIDLAELPHSEREAAAAKTLTAEAHIPFDMTTGPLIRATLIQFSDGEHVLLLAMHHVVSDDWSMGVLFRELSGLYESFVTGRKPGLPPLPIQYSDFAAWQHSWMQGEVLCNQLEYWKERLAGAPRLLQLPTDRPRPAKPTHQGAREELVLPTDLIKKLTQVSQREGCTLFMSLLAAFQNLLVRYTGQEDIVVGAPIAGRSRAETEGLIGYFINTLVLRTDLSGDPTFSELLRRVRDVALGAYAHQDLPFERLVEELQPERSLTQPPLFQVMFIFQNAPAVNLHPAGLVITPEAVLGAPAPLDLTMEVREMADGMHCWFEYKTELFDCATIRLMAERFHMLLEKVSQHPEQSLSSLHLLTAAEHEQMFGGPEVGTSETETSRCIHELFEAQVERTPAAIAVIHEKEKLTYAELNTRANHLAHYLRTMGVGPEVLVGLCMERSLEMIVGVMGILKAGGAYVPLDPTYPQARLAQMIMDAGMPVILTQRSRLPVLPEFDAAVVCIDSDWRQIVAAPADNPSCLGTAGNLAYVIYTSGSTGQPKGVMIQHSSLVNYTESASLEFGLGHGDRVLQFASLNFDTSAEEIFPCLTRGAKLVLRTSEMLASVHGFLQRCRDLAITVLDLPTAYWHELVAQIDAENLELPPSLRLVIIGGERALPQRLATWQEHFGAEVRLVNTYGPTEATIVATLWEPTESVEISANSLREVPIGKPVRNVKAYILNAALQPVPAGATGELHIGGGSLARGYLKRPELTAEKFNTDPFSRQAGARLYKTGDLARYLPDGNLEYAGRIDDQVKVRGFRIELGEIEAVLNQHPAVHDSVVIARDDLSGNRRLVAYAIPRDHFALSGDDLRNQVKQKLPEYMVPSVFLILKSFPLTANGKIDRNSLPSPDQQPSPRAKNFTAPRTEAELKLAKIWAQVLQLDSVSITDNFFDLGGHSLLAVRLFAQIRKVFGKELPLAILFQAPTIQRLAATLCENGWTAHWSPLVAIQPHGSARPFFAIHAVGGNVLEYNALAKHMGEEQPFYALQAEGLDGELPTYISIEQMAANYIREIRTVQAEGPYQIGGRSFGGLVAFEMAVQLSEQGHDVSLLALMDTYPLGYQKLAVKSGKDIEVPGLQKKVSAHMRNLRTLGAMEKLKYLFEKSTYGPKKVQIATWRTLYRLFRHSSRSLPRILRSVELFNYMAAREYLPRPYSGKVTLLWASEDLNTGHDAIAGWEFLAAGGVEVRELPGTHLNIIKEPFVADLAREISNCIAHTTPPRDEAEPPALGSSIKWKAA